MPPKYYYGHPPPSSVCGPDAGECKEGEDPCYNAGCENCKRTHLKTLQQTWWDDTVSIRIEGFVPEALEA